LDPAEWSGTETAIKRLFDGLRSHGVTPAVYCPKLDRNGTADPLAQAGYEVQRFRAFVPVFGLSPQRRRQLIAVGGNLMSFDLFPALRRDKQFDVIHTHTLGRLGGIALRTAKSRRVPFVVTIHGGVFDLPDKLKAAFNAPPSDGWEWGKLFGMLFQSHRLFCDADAILTCNPKEAAQLQQRFPRKRIEVQPHGVPLETYRRDHRAAARAAFPQIENRQVLLCLGRIDPVKNQAWLLEHAPAFLQRHPRALLVLAGPCTDEVYGAHVRQRIRELGIAERVLLTGGLPPEDPRLLGLLQSAEVLLLPSVSETFGLVILEAWAAGTMVVAARASGPSALIEHGQNGWLFELDEPSTFHEALDCTLNKPELAPRMVARGALLTAKYSVEALASRLKRLYEQLVEEYPCAT
jgi:glycosyltransferase involved in cell wall biosynthesis